MSRYEWNRDSLSTRRVSLNYMQNIYLLKDLANVSGHSTHTLKYYLRLGLLQEMGRSPTTNFRYFDDFTVQQLQEIRKLQQKNFSLNAIKEILTSSPKIA